MLDGMFDGDEEEGREEKSGGATETIDWAGVSYGVYAGGSSVSASSGI